MLLHYSAPSQRARKVRNSMNCGWKSYFVVVAIGTDVVDLAFESNDWCEECDDGGDLMVNQFFFFFRLRLACPFLFPSLFSQS